jgi:hypothetical protein
MRRDLFRVLRAWVLFGLDEAIDAFKQARERRQVDAFYRAWCAKLKASSIDNAKRQDLPW